MNGEVIKSFLVGLGFEVDNNSLAKFNQSIGQATLKITALFAATKAMSAAVIFGISKISEGFEQMGYEFRIISPAINKALTLRRELLKAYSAAGINITKVIQNSIKLNMSLTKTRYALDAIYKSVGSRFFTAITKQSDLFRERIYKNMPRIQNALEKLVKFIFKALEATTQLGSRLWSILTRVYDFFEKLHKATDGWSSVIIGVIAAWKLLNLSFLATPLGALLTGFVALLALWDDFKTFQEGGESLFNWTSFIPVIDAVIKHFEILKSILEGIFTIIFGIGAAIANVFRGQWIQAVDALKQAFDGLLQVMSGVMAQFGSVLNIGGAVGGWAASLFGNENAQTNIQNNPAMKPMQNPLGAGASNSLTNQNVQQQTSINVMGSADANAVGKAVAGEQTRVNFDMIRNMKGAAR